MNPVPHWARTGAHIHIVGIKGVAMTSLAQILLDLGCIVTGSDVAEDFVTHALLSSFPLKIYEGFSPEHIEDSVQMVIFTGAHQGRKNIEVVVAQERGIPVLNHAEALATLVKPFEVVAVCGVGGKSTVSAMLAYIFSQASKNIGYSVGVGNITGLNRTGSLPLSKGEVKQFIVEADEYACEPGVDNTSRFLFFDPSLIVCTNIAFDHPDVFSSFDETKDRYAQFFDSLHGKENGLLVYHGDDAELCSLVQSERFSKVSKIRYGTSIENDLRIESIQTKPGDSLVRFVWHDVTYELHLNMPGEHNAKNAMAAFLCAIHAGEKPQAILEALSQFKGTMRRFEHVGQHLGVEWYDDYAHHPNEIEQTIQAMREWAPGKKVFVVFQPHTFSRTKALLNDFAVALTMADEVFLPDIFASAREPFDATVTSAMLAKQVNEKGGHAIASGDLLSTLALLKVKVPADAVVITMGAGDVYKLVKML